MSDAESAGDDLRLRARRWLIATVLSGLALVVSIIVGLGATVWRLQQTMESMDALDDRTFAAMVERSLLWTKIGLGVGTLAFLAYLVSHGMFHRTREQIRALRREPAGKHPEHT